MRRRVSWSSGAPCHRTSPASARTKPRAIRIVVVLPAPLEPQNPNIDPGATVNPTPSSTWLSPKLLCSPSNSSTRSSLVGCCPETYRRRPLARGGRLRSNRGNSENIPAHAPARVGFEGLGTAAAGCRACELWEPATQTVFGEGPETARVVMVGEQRGDEEDRKGERFVAPG